MNLGYWAPFYHEYTPGRSIDEANAEAAREERLEELRWRERKEREERLEELRRREREERKREEREEREWRKREREREREERKEMERKEREERKEMKRLGFAALRYYADNQRASLLLVKNDGRLWLLLKGLSIAGVPVELREKIVDFAFFGKDAPEGKATREKKEEALSKKALAKKAQFELDLKNLQDKLESNPEDKEQTQNLIDDLVAKYTATKAKSDKRNAELKARVQYEAKIAHLRQCIINEPDRRQQFEDEIDYVISTRNKELADGEPDSDSEEEESEEEDWSEDDESDSDSESGSEREEMECEFALEEVQNVNGALQYTGRFLCFS